MVGYYLFLVFEKLLMILPRWIRRNFFFLLGRLAYRVDRKHRKVIQQNLDFAIPGLSSETQEEIGKYCYKNLSLALLQVMEDRYISKERLRSMVSFENLDIVEQAKASGRPIIFVTAHYGNWELAGAALSAFVMPTSAVHKALNNAHFDHYLHASRSRFGMTMVEKRGAVKHLAKVLKANGAISLLTDQNTSEKDGIVVRFFGQDARQTAAPAFLARKYNAPIIPVYIRTEDDKNFTMRFYDAIEVEQTDDPNADILKATQAQADLHEQVIKEEPKFWFWCHRRWKTEHPEIYNN